MLGSSIAGIVVGIVVLLALIGGIVFLVIRWTLVYRKLRKRYRSIGRSNAQFQILLDSNPVQLEFHLMVTYIK